MPWFCWLFSKNKKETRVKRWRIQNKYRLLQIWSRRVSPADGGRRVSKLEPTKLSPLRDWFLLEREFFDGRLCESSSSNGVMNEINKKKIFFEMTKQSPPPSKKKTKKTKKEMQLAVMVPHRAKRIPHFLIALWLRSRWSHRWRRQLIRPSRPRTHHLEAY